MNATRWLGISSIVGAMLLASACVASAQGGASCPMVDDVVANLTSLSLPNA